MREGERTRGLWMPLALSTIVQALYTLIRVNGAKDLKTPDASEVLSSWALPFLAGAVEEMEEGAKAEEAFAFVENLARKKLNE